MVDKDCATSELGVVAFFSIGVQSTSFGSADKVIGRDLLAREQLVGFESIDQGWYSLGLFSWVRAATLLGVLARGTERSLDQLGCRLLETLGAFRYS